MKEFDFYECDLLTTKLLLESKKVDYINIGFQQGEYVSILMDTKVLELTCIPLSELLTADNIKTNSLIINLDKKGFNTDFSSVNIKFVFYFLTFLNRYL